MWYGVANMMRSTKLVLLALILSVTEAIMVMGVVKAIVDMTTGAAMFEISTPFTS